MSAVGSSADNALAESFNATFKRETLQGRKSWPDEREARLDAFRWLHRYNTRRRHSRLGQRSPIAFENAFHLTPTTLAQAAYAVFRIRGQGPTAVRAVPCCLTSWRIRSSAQLSMAEPMPWPRCSGKR